LEFKKEPGAGTDVWPDDIETYTWSDQCLTLDPLKRWWSNVTNRDAFAHLTHTFTHLELNNATYHDASREIAINAVWLQHAGFAAAMRFTPDGLVPPAITGLHNADVLRAWTDNGLVSCVGDNTRPPLVNQQNGYHPYITSVQNDGFAGFQVNPRWATRIYYNCDTPNCTTQEWIDTSAGVGNFQTLLGQEKADTMRHLLGLRRDSYMFHQANLRQTDIGNTNINGVSAKRSLYMCWVETVVQELVRLVNWPILSQKFGDMSAGFAARAARDGCGYSLKWTSDGTKITGVTVGANGNSCASPIPVTFPTPPTSTLGFQTEQIGNDPLTVWVTLSGSPVTFTLASPIVL